MVKKIFFFFEQWVKTKTYFCWIIRMKNYTCSIYIYWLQVIPCSIWDSLTLHHFPIQMWNIKILLKSSYLTEKQMYIFPKLTSKTNIRRTNLYKLSHCFLPETVFFTAPTETRNWSKDDKVLISSGGK